MQAFKGTGTIDEKGELTLDQPLKLAENSRVKVIVLVQDPASRSSESSVSADDTPADEILADLRQSWREATTGQTIPASEIWDDLENE